MITISELDDLAIAAVAACDTLVDYALVSSEAELKDLLLKLKFPLLVCAYPSADGDDRNVDNYAESNLALFYVLTPFKESFSKTDRTDAWAKTQQGMKELKEFIKEQMTNQDSPFFELLQDADFGKRSIDPEYNFLGNVGWSLKFDFTTSGL